MKKSLIRFLPLLLLLLCAIISVGATEGEEPEFYQIATADLFQEGSFTAQNTDPYAVSLFDAE
jgi:hypothetical protein